MLYIVFVSHLCNRIWSSKTIRISNIMRVFRSNECNVSNYGKHKQHSSLILREIMDLHVCDIEGKITVEVLKFFFHQSHPSRQCKKTCSKN